MAEIDDVKLRVTQNEIDIDALQSKEDAQDLDIANFYTKIANTDSTVAALDLRFDNYDVQLDALSARINGNDIDIDAHDGRIWNLEIDVTDLQVRVNFLESQTLPEGVAPPSVIDNLTSIDATAALSANQGRVLKNKQDELVTDYNTLNTRVTTIEASVNGTSVSVVDNLTSVDTTAALSANQGRALKALTDALDTRVTNVETKATNNETNITDITTRVEGVETLSSQNSTDIAALQASDATNQVNITNNATAISNNSNEITVLEGRVLTLEEAADAEILVEDNLTSTSTTTALSANQGRVLKEGQDAIDVRLTNEEAATATAVTDINDLQTRVTYIENAGGYVPIDVIDTLTSQETRSALSANQGRVLKEVQDQIVLDVDTLENRLTTEESNNAVFSADIQNLKDRLTIEENKTYVIDDLIDVNAGGTIGDNQVLTYNLSTDTWEPGYPTASLGITSFAYRYSTADTATPGSGTINTNNTADPTAVTYVYVNAVDDTGTDVTLFLDEITEGDWINLYNKDDQSIEEAYDVSGTVVRVGNVYQIPVTYYTHSATRLSNNGQIKLFWKKVVQTPEATIVEDTLTSTSTVNALSANQGYVLSERIKDIEEGADIPVGTYIIGSIEDEERLGLLGYRKADVDKEYNSNVFTELSNSFSTPGVVQDFVIDGEMRQSNSSIEIAENIYARTNHNYASTIVSGEVLGDIIIQRGIADNPTDKWIFDASAYFDTIGVYPIGVSKINKNDDYWYLHVAGKLSGTLNIVTLRYNPKITDFSSFVSDIVVTSSVIPSNVGVSSASFVFCTDNFFVFYTPSTSTKWTRCGLNADGTSDQSFSDVPFVYTADNFDEKCILSNNHVFERGEIINLSTDVRTVLNTYDCRQNHSTFTINNKVYLCYESDGVRNSDPDDFTSVYIINEDSSYELLYKVDNKDGKTYSVIFDSIAVLTTSLNNSVGSPYAVLGLDLETDTAFINVIGIDGYNTEAFYLCNSKSAMSRNVRKYYFSNSFLMNDVKNTGTTELTQKITVVYDKTMFTVPGIANPNEKLAYYINTGVPTSGINPL